MKEKNVQSSITASQRRVLKLLLGLFTGLVWVVSLAIGFAHHKENMVNMGIFVIPAVIQWSLYRPLRDFAVQDTFRKYTEKEIRQQANFLYIGVASVVLLPFVFALLLAMP